MILNKKEPSSFLLLVVRPGAPFVASEFVTPVHWKFPPRGFSTPVPFVVSWFGVDWEGAKKCDPCGPFGRR